MAKRGDTEAEEAALYSGPPEDFVSGRNALAKRLSEEGDGAGAARVKKLKKPSLPAWAVNRAARESPDAAKGLLDSGEALAKAQRGAAGEGGGQTLRDAMSAHQEAVETLMADVDEALAEAGHASAANADRARETLRALATDDELRDEFEAGRVVTDREPVGFGSAPAPKAAPKRKRDPEEARRRKEEEKARAAAEKRVKRAEAKVAKAERALEAAREELEEAERAL